jgi:uncharacterized membrane protein
MRAERDSSSTRLDAFVDAAFAFAVTLLVIGGGEPPRQFAELEAVMWRIPAFAVGFALIGMFWHAHVRWRRLCGNDGVPAVLLSFALVFLVLVYVYPLRMMADSMVGYFAGRAGALGYVDLPGLFTLYGLGFAGMSALVAVLFYSGLRRSELAPADRPVVRGEIGIWLILAGSGVLSVLLAQFDATVPFAPWVYSLLPVAIGVFAWRHRWEEAPAGEGAA